VMMNLLAQLGDALRGVRPRHARSIAPALSLADCLAARVRVTLYCGTIGREFLQ
jgi:hypothetical protein